MTDYGTIKIPLDEWEAHNERRSELGLTWAEYIDGQAPEQDLNVDLSEVLGRIDDLESTLPRKVAEQLR